MCRERGKRNRETGSVALEKDLKGWEVLAPGGMLVGTV